MASTTSSANSSTDASTTKVNLTGTVVNVYTKVTETDGSITSVTIEQPSGTERKASQTSRFRPSPAARRSSARATGEVYVLTVGGEEGKALVEGIKKGSEVRAIGSIYASDPYRTLVNLESIEVLPKAVEPENAVTLVGELVKSNDEGDLMYRIPLSSGGSLHVMVLQLDGQCYAVLLRGVEAKKLANGRKLGEEVEVEGRLYSHKVGSKRIMNIDVTAINAVVASSK